MSILNPLSWFKGGQTHIEEKASAAGSVISAYNVGQAIWSSRDFAAYSKVAYSINPVGFRCVKKIATAAASVSWLLHDAAGKEVTKNHY